MQNFVILSIVSIAVLGLFVFADVQFSEATHEDNYRNVDGTGNNIGNPTWGNSGEQLIREDGLSAYGNGASEPAGASRPSARVISNAIFSQSSSVPDTLGTTDMFWLWGQFDLGARASRQAPTAKIPAGPPFKVFNEFLEFPFQRFQAGVVGILCLDF